MKDEGRVGLDPAFLLLTRLSGGVLIFLDLRSNPLIC